MTTFIGSTLTTISRKTLVGAASFLSVATIALCGSAGQSNPRAATCTFYSDGSGYCSGTLQAFRKSSDATADLTLQSYVYSAGVSRYVSVTFAGTNKFLPVSSTIPQSAISLFDAAAISVSANVYVHWNTSSQVDVLQFFNDSGLL